MKTNLNKELDKLIKKEDSNSCEKIKDATLLLESPKENLQILENINLDYQIRINKKIVNDSNKIKFFSEKFSKKVITGKEIKDLCNLYDLKCLISSDYKSKLCPELSNKLVEFENENKITLFSRNCFIVSLPEAFDQKCSDENFNTLFLYRENYNNTIANEDDIFTVIHSWGNNLNSKRKYNFLISGQLLLSLLFLILSIFASYYIYLSLLLIIVAIGFIYDKCIRNQSQDITWNSLEKN